MANTLYDAGVKLLRSAVDDQCRPARRPVPHEHRGDQPGRSGRAAGKHVGNRHVNFVESNRRAAGFGPHRLRADRPETIHEIGYSGYASAEAFPLPDSDTAAEQTIHAANSSAISRPGDSQGLYADRPSFGSWN